MHLVEYTDVEDEFEISLNYFICNLAGIRKTRCDKSDVPATIKRVIDSYKGKRVKFIYGGGKSLEGVYAYYDAVAELSKQTDKVDHLFISCGTGTTLTGICAGMQEFFPNAIVHAVSVSRTYDVEKPILDEDIQLINTYMSKHYSFDNMKFYEEFLCGGYDKTTPELLKCVKDCIEKDGMIVDPCYSGKSFYGMCEIIKNSPITYQGKNIVYWNTGGIMNLLSMKNVYGF